MLVTKWTFLKSFEPGRKFYFSSGPERAEIAVMRAGSGPEKLGPCRPLMSVNKIVSKWCIRLSSNSEGILQVTVGRILLIFVNVGYLVFYFLLPINRESIVLGSKF